MRLLPFALFAALAACEPMIGVPDARPARIKPVEAGPKLSTQAAMANFRAAVRRIEPVAEQTCRAQTTGQNCDFRIVVDERPDLQANAFQILDDNGRPILVFTLPLLQEARNVDEIAFVLAHEAAHHIEGHYARQAQNAAVGAALLGTLAGSLGSTDPAAIESASRVGAAVAARSFSKDFELEADALGTRITAAAGFDPLKGAQFFFRIPDPGDRFLGTHPANADRLRTVERVAAGL